MTDFEGEQITDVAPDVTEEFLDLTNLDLGDLPPVEGESPFENATPLVGDGACIVCGAPTFRPPGLTATGRKKRTPRYCDLHAPNSRVSQDGPSIAGMESQLRNLQDELADNIRLLGTLSGPLFPVTGYYMITNADPFTIAILQLVKNNPKMLKALYRAGQISPVYRVGKFLAGVADAVKVDQQKDDVLKMQMAHNTISTSLGVDKAYDAIFPAQSVSTNNFATNGGYPRYATVS